MLLVDSDVVPLRVPKGAADPLVLLKNIYLSCDHLHARPDAGTSTTPTSPDRSYLMVTNLQPGPLNTTNQIIRDLETIYMGVHIGDIRYMSGYFLGGISTPLTHTDCTIHD